MCPGGVTGRALVALKISAANPPVPTVAWCSAIAGNASTAPIATTTDGTSNAIVWFINNANTLKALDGDTGHADSEQQQHVLERPALDVADRAQQQDRRRRQRPPLLLVAAVALAPRAT